MRTIKNQKQKIKYKKQKLKNFSSLIFVFHILYFIFHFAKTTMLTKIVIGLLIVGLGSLLVIKTQWFCNWFGGIPFAEKYLGTEGGSRLFYKLLGLIIIFFGFLIATNLVSNFFIFILPDALIGR